MLLSCTFHIKLSLCSVYLHRNHDIAQVVLKLHAKLIQVFSLFTEQAILKYNAYIYYINAIDNRVPEVY